MRLLTCVLLWTGLLSGSAFADDDDKKSRNAREDQAGSISEGLARGSLRPFLELTTKQSNPGDDTLRLHGFRLGLSEGGERQLALAFYRSGSTRFDAGTSYELSYGGVVFGDPPQGDRITEGYFQMLVGTGQAKVETAQETRTSRLLFVLEPEIGIGVNITPWMQIGAGVSYRYLNGLQVLGLGSEELRGGTANLHLLLQL
ncbi:MAG TPA: hypothetical protein VE954_07855 [Oligoflexus sp.]|uniref:hypothetical protein n=1 Tax=Oligoflexus sp. TaxID=1971216 RepID=UPI002D669974|nr:hypothetical protein [Oligoflexus sp.]HYX33015.1 hypothetical protein [Oligoflexus sp.]